MATSPDSHVCASRIVQFNFGLASARRYVSFTAVLVVPALVLAVAGPKLAAISVSCLYHPDSLCKSPQVFLFSSPSAHVSS